MSGGRGRGEQSREIEREREKRTGQKMNKSENSVRREGTHKRSEKGDGG